MSPYNEVKIVFLQKFFNHVIREDVGDSTLILSPAFGHKVQNNGGVALTWIRPKQVGQDAKFWNLGGSLELLDLAETFQVGAQSTMHSQYSVLDDCCNG